MKDNLELAKVIGVCVISSQLDETWSSLIPFSLSLCAARPSKEEKARLADEKNAANSVKAEAVAVAGDEDAVGEEEDAEGEEE